MSVNVNQIASSLNIKLNSFLKLLNRLGFSSTQYLNCEELKKIRSLCIDSKHYRKKLLVLELNKILNNCKDISNE